MKKILMISILYSLQQHSWLLVLMRWVSLILWIIDDNYSGQPAGLIQWFVAHVSSRRDIQKRAHEELDRVVGCDRLPTVEDQTDLPYCRAIIKEVQRYHNGPFWLGNPHATSEDFFYRDYHIPKNTVIILNTYSMHFNEVRYPDPFAFNVSRNSPGLIDFDCLLARLLSWR